jgi:hypothetical protein
VSLEHWNKVVELFHAAREKTAVERVVLLDSACSNDPHLRLAVEQMLRDHEAECSFLHGPENRNSPSGNFVTIIRQAAAR